MIDHSLTPVVEAVFALAAAILTAYAIPWLKAKLGNEKFSTLAGWVSIAVRSAEEIFNYPDAGNEKKAYVKEFIGKMGLSQDGELLDNLIEAEVYSIQK